MARKKKLGITSEESKIIDSLNVADLLPNDVETLQATVCALLNRIRRMDEQAARQIAFFVRLLAACEEFWKKNRTNPLDGLEAKEEWDDNFDLLAEIALGEKTNHDHCKPSVRRQTGILDEYLQEHNEFSKCRNATTRLAWIEKHGPAIFDALSIVPCFCTYSHDGLVAPAPPPNWERDPIAKYERRLIDPILQDGATPAKLRDVLLGILHGTTDKQIAKIRKKPNIFTTESQESLLSRPLYSVTGFPFR